MSESPDNAPVTVEPLTLREQIADWWHRSEKKRTVAGLAAATIGLLIACILLATRDPDTVVVGPPNMKSELVYATAKDGQDLGDVGKPHGKTRLEMIALNEALIVANTAKCDRLGRKNGVCTRTMFAGRELAWDALWSGDKPIVGTRQVEETTTLASTQ